MFHKRHIERIPARFDNAGHGHPASSLSFTVDSGTVLAFSGPENICHTVARLATGRLRAKTGSVFFMKRDLATFSQRELQAARVKNLALLVAAPRLDPAITVVETLMFPSVLTDTISPEQASHQARHILREHDLGNIANKKVGHLITPEVRWVALLQILMQNPQFLVVENGAIENSSSQTTGMIDCIREYALETKTGVLWTTTSIRAACTADRLLIYSRGEAVDIDDAPADFATSGF